MKKKSLLGFNLIELMIVIAIIAILTAIALPQYQNYITRAKITEGLLLAMTAKAGVIDYYEMNGVLPSSNEEAGLNDSISSHYVSSIEIQNQGNILITFNEKSGVGDGNTLLLKPKFDGELVEWTCSGNIQNKFLPANCRE
ncbi:MAG: pilin [Gammaproteobacteria bacterium]